MDENLLLIDEEPIPEEALALSGEIRDVMNAMLDAYITDEEYDDNLQNILEEDDYLTEELVDKLAALNILEDAPEGTVSNEDMEQAYLTVIDSFFELSKMISPMNGFGRDRLEAGLSLIRQFEGQHFLLSTQIVPENAEAFSELISVEHYEDILAGRKRAIGALRHMGEEVYAAGALVYSVRDDSEDEPYVSLEWIMVHESLRKQGIGNFLMALVIEAALSLNENDISISVELPVRQAGEEEELREFDVLENFFDSWKFAFSIGYGSRFAIALSDIAESAAIREMDTGGVKSLSELGKQGEKQLKAFFESRNKSYDADIAALPFGFFDPGVSCVVHSGEEIRSVLLFHRFGNGDYRYEAYRATDEADFTDLPKLIAFAYGKAAGGEDGDTMITGTFASEEGYDEAGRLLPNARISMVYRGAMYPPDEAITSEQWGRLREEAGFLNNKFPEE